MNMERIVLVTRETRLDGLLQRFGTKGQARFQVEQAGGDFGEYLDEHTAYVEAVSAVRRMLDFDLPVHEVDRRFVPTYVFGGSELIVTVGQDGLVANIARYVQELAIVAVNPDPTRFDGHLLPYTTGDVREGVAGALSGRCNERRVTLAEARLQDGQKLTAFNDLFIGAASHVSARYRLSARGAEEDQSSSGVLISTGAGSTGWMSSVFHMVAGISATFGQGACESVQMKWDDPRLFWVAREPFVSNHSGATLVCGFIDPGEEIVLESSMSSDGVIFGDGMEQDFLSFNAGSRVTIQASDERARLIVPN